MSDTTRIRHRLAVLGLLAVAIFGIAHAASAQGSGPGTPGYTGPTLELPIPGVEFSDIIRDGEVTIPWIGQYVGGVYKFLISIVGLFAASVMIFGGFQYVTSAGDKAKISAAKKRMTNAFMGLLLVFGSYTILYAINPATLNFEGLQIDSVRGTIWTRDIDRHMSTTTSDTAQSEEAPTPPPPSGSSAPAGDYKYSITSCPWTWETTKRDDRKEEFIKKFAQYVTKTTYPEKTLQIAEMADVCDVILGSCGTTVGSILAMAYRDQSTYEGMSKRSSAKNADCLDRKLKQGTSDPDDKFNCGGFRFRTVREVSSNVHREQYGRRCTLDGFAAMQKNFDKLVAAYLKNDDKNESHKAYYEKYGRIPVSGLGKCNTTDCIANGVHVPRPEGECSTSQSGARLAFLAKLQAAGDAGDSTLKGYPDSWTKELLPGDYVNIYNGNTDLTGGHAQLFLGWDTDKKHAHVIQGGASGKGCTKECGVTRYGHPCYTSGCGNSFMPITSIYRPY